MQKSADIAAILLALLVIRAGFTHLGLVQQTVSEARQAKVNIVGAILNVICFIVCFLLLLLVIHFVINFLKVVFKFPVLKQLTGFELTRGVLVAMKRRPLPEPSALLHEARRVAVLERIMNPTNLGAVFRSAAAFDIDAVLLTEGSSDPLYRR